MTQPPSPPPSASHWQTSRVDPVPGTEFGLIQLRVDPVTSGLAIGSLLAGIGSVLVSLLVLCFGLVGAGEGWGGIVSGAFTVTSVIAGCAAIGVGVASRRQIRQPGASGQVRFTGAGVAMSGIVCGAVGTGIALLSLALTLLVQMGS